ncbi:MAG TPA: maleylacetoacetate isomerase [Polyangiaceae bacterium]|jgi:maleylpyruvate isomerase|nr:maleylacetoacetate isomerase [Polyangiaceae bacterium]
MRLYGFWRSSATWRVRIALAHKGLAYEYTPVHLTRDGGEQHRPEFRALNPMRHVPVLEVDDAGRVHRLAESMAILEFLEEMHPSPPLLPEDRWMRARARQLALLIVSGIQPLQNTKVQNWVRETLGADEKAWVKHWITLGFDALEELTKETARTFSVGDRVSIADVCLVPQCHMAARVGVDVSRYPTLHAIERACAELPAFVAAHADRQADAEPAK